MASHRTTNFNDDAEDDELSLLESRLIRSIRTSEPKRPLRFRERNPEKQIRKYNPRIAREHMY